MVYTESLSLKSLVLSQWEVACLVGEPLQNITFWEQAEKPPRGEVLPKMAQALGVKVEDLLNMDAVAPKQAKPAGNLREVMQEAATLPRKQQDKVAEFIAGYILQYKQSQQVEK